LPESYPHLPVYRMPFSRPSYLNGLLAGVQEFEMIIHTKPKTSLDFFGTGPLILTKPKTEYAKSFCRTPVGSRPIGAYRSRVQRVINTRYHPGERNLKEICIGYISLSSTWTSVSDQNVCLVKCQKVPLHSAAGLLKSSCSCSSYRFTAVSFPYISSSETHLILN
jgi:hypothetical protein